MKKSKITSLLLTGALAVSMMAMGTIGAFATGINEEATTEQQETSALNVVKQIQYPDGTTTEGKTFTVNVTAMTAAQATEKGIAEDNLITDGAPAIGNISIEMDALTTGTAGVNKVTKAVQAQIVSAFSSAATGKYVYAITEDQTGEKAADDKYGWTMDDSEYLLQVFKKADGSVTYTIYSYDEKTKLSNEVTKSDDGTITNFDGAAAFVNIFTKRAGENSTGGDVDGDGNTDSLVITNTVTGGELPASDKAFTYTINFTQSDLDTPVTSYTATKVKEDGTKEDVTVNVENGTFTLENGDKLVFDDIMAGTYYTVTEAGKTDVTPKVDVTENGTKKGTINGTKAADLTAPVTGTILIGENQNEADFVNAVTDITVTGLALQAAPYAALIGLGLAMMAAYVMMRRRMESR